MLTLSLMLALSPIALAETGAGDGKAVDLVKQSDPLPETGRGLRIAGITSSLAGFALLGAGVVFHAAASKTDAQIRDGAVNRVSLRNRYETMGWVGYGTGAAALATGTVLYLMGLEPDRKDEPRLSLRPAFERTRVSLMLGGAF